MSSQPDPSIVLDNIEAFRRSKTMFAAVELGVFDELDAQAETAEAIASKLSVDTGALTRLLDGCVALGLLARQGSTYRNDPVASRYLIRSSPDCLADYVIYSDQSLYKLWSHLDDAVREGTNRWQQAFGDRNALFDHYFRDEKAAGNFLGGMHGFGQISSPKVVRAFDLSRFRHLADLGGATGHLAIAACEAYPQLIATVADLARVVPFARAHVARSSARDRIDMLACDFFADPLPAGDLYALSRILHDWGEDRIHSLLKKIAAALPAGGGLLVAEALLDDGRSSPRFAVMQNLNMLVCADGRERTLAEYESLLRSAAFRK